MRSIVRASKRGFTLIELMIVVAIVGILAVLAIYGVRKYLANAKTAEARNNLGQLSKDLDAAYEGEAYGAGSGTALPDLGNIGISHLFCANAAVLPPAVPAAQKIQIAKAAWDNDPGWACSKFVVDAPVYYQYSWTNTGTGTTEADQQALLANGDLNGDGVLSTFQMTNVIHGKRYAIAPNVLETLPEE
jgi:type IV pilus assembly protein PilA